MTSARPCLGPVILLFAAGASACGAAGAAPKLFSEDEAAWIRQHVGVYAWPALDFPGYDYSIAECADLAQNLGTRVIRVIFEPRLLKQPDFIALARTSDYQRLFARFGTVVLTMSRWDPNEPGDFAATRREYERFAAYLLKGYAGTGKAFIFGFWEGDNAGMTGPPAVAWCNARHEGIARARASVGEKGVRVLEMIECNYDGISLMPPQKSFTAESSMARTVLPHTAADLYSFSAWMDLPPTPYRHLGAALDALAARVPPGKVFGRRNVMLGEAGLYEQLLSPDETFEAVRGILTEARRWGVPYVILWWLSGRESGLVDARRFGGTKSELWHPFWAAYHGGGDTLVVEDFNEADLGPDGRLRNHLGGAEYTWSERGPGRVVAAVETWGGEGVLRLGSVSGLAPGERAGWTTELGCLDARRYPNLVVPMGGPYDQEIGLRDTAGHESWQRRRAAMPLAAFARRGVDLSRLAALSVRLPTNRPPPGDLIGRIRLTRGTPTEEPLGVNGERTTALVVQGLSAPQIVPDMDADPGAPVRRFEVRLAEGSGPAVNPRLACGGEELPLIGRLVPGSHAWAKPGGVGGFEFAAPFRRRLREDFERCDLQPHNLRWEPEFSVWMPTAHHERCWLETTINSPYPITGASLLIQGRKSGAAQWGVTVLQGDKPFEGKSVATFQWVDRELFRLPDDWTPYQWIRLRFWLQVNREDAGWEWDGSFGLVNARLDLDTSCALLLKPSPIQPLVFTDRAGVEARRLVTVQFGGR
jgi:hypothetical protein